MFRSIQIGATLSLLSQDAKAAKVTYRPSAEAAPWYKTHNGPTWQDPTWPVNYFVPNFGVDKEIAVSQQNLGSAEGTLKTKMQATFAKPVAPPRDYFVPNFGVDKDITMTDLNIGEAEEQHGQKLSVDAPKATPPRNYFVPNFGVDKEILGTQESLQVAEDKMKVKFDEKVLVQPKPFPNGYTVPNFGQDNDIKVSLENTGKAESQLNHVWKALQLDNAEKSDIMIESDPICSTAGCTQYGHPAPKDSTTEPPPAVVDYPVPNFGKDPDMISTMNSIKIAEEMNTHKLVMGTPESKAKWHNVAKDTLYNYQPALDKDVINTNRHIAAAEDQLGFTMVQLQDDPIGSSIGVTQYLHPGPKEKPYPMNYVVPNFGVDQEILDFDSNLAKTETELKKKFNPDLKKDENPKNYKVPNFGVDQDMKDATANIAMAEEAHGPWTPKQDANGVWIVPQPISASSYSYDAGHVDHYVQLDEQMNMGSDPIGSTLGITQYLLPHYKDPLAPAVMDYKVPNFGADPEVAGVMNSLSIAEEQLKHKLVMGTPESQAKWHNVAKNTLYDYAPELEEDIKTTWKHIDAAQESLGVTFEDANLIQSDPIEGSVGGQFGHPAPNLAKAEHPPPAAIDYPVPQLGKDQDDVITTANSIKIAEEQTKHPFVMGTPEQKAKYHIVAKDILYNYAPALDKDVVSTQKSLSDTEDRLSTSMIQMRDDPIGSSIGITQYMHPGPKSSPYPLNYAVPNFGVDSGILDVTGSIAAAEKSTGIPFKWKDSAPEDVTEYRTDRPLDVDIQASISNMHDMEGIHGAWDAIQLSMESAAQSDPIMSSEGVVTQYLHPAPKDTTLQPAAIDYPVPSFGADPDMATTMQSIKIAEEQVKHKLVMGTLESKAKWHNVAKDTLYDYSPKLDADVITTNRNIAKAEDDIGVTMTPDE